MLRPRKVLRRRAIARTAIVGGSAYAAAKGGADAGGQEQEEMRAPESAPPAGAVTATLVEQLKELAELREQGILSDEEFAAEKKRLLGM